MAKILVVYYSRTGNTEKAAKELAYHLDADIEKLVDCENRKGALGYIRGFKDASNEKITVIEQPQYHPGEYDVVILATPTWVINMAPALRTYIHYYRYDLSKVAFLVTQHGSCKGKIYEEMKEAVGKLPIAVTDIGSKDFKDGNWREKIKELTVKMNVG